MIKMMNYWNELNALGIEEYLNSYKTDFTEHDKQDLEGYTGDFILAVRKTGTNLLKLNKDEKNTKEMTAQRKQDLKDNVETWILRHNLRFFHGTQQGIREIEKERVMKIVDLYNDGMYYN